MICLYVRAPFAAFRDFSAGYYRRTAPFITPSAAYGLVLNVAGVESRRYGPEFTTGTSDGLPTLRVALGAVRLPAVQTLYQQLHNAPVGKSGRGSGESIARARGTKSNVQPVRRELLVGVEAYICVEAPARLEEAVRMGLQLGARRQVDGRPAYGVPFLGENNHMVDVLREVPEPGPAYWWVRAPTGRGESVRDRAVMTIWVDRTISARTVTMTMARLPEARATIPDEAWVVVGPDEVVSGEGS